MGWALLKVGCDSTWPWKRWWIVLRFVPHLHATAASCDGFLGGRIRLDGFCSSSRTEEIKKDIFHCGNWAQVRRKLFWFVSSGWWNMSGGTRNVAAHFVTRSASVGTDLFEKRTIRNWDVITQKWGPEIDYLIAKAEEKIGISSNSLSHAAGLLFLFASRKLCSVVHPKQDWRPSHHWLDNGGKSHTSFCS